MYPKERDLKYEEELWPDPEDAPLVPPQNYLRAYLEDRESLPPVLTEQIRGSINCRRALENLPAAVLLEDILEEEKPKLDLPSTEEVDELIEEINVDNLTHFAKRGSIYTTSCYQTQNEENGNLGYFNFSPQTVLVLSEPDDDFCNVVPCSPEACWPEENRGLGDLVIEPNGFVPVVAHLWCEKDIPMTQLRNLIGQVELPHYSELCFDPPEGLDELATIQVLQLKACAVYLTGNIVQTKGLLIPFIEFELKVGSTSNTDELDYRCYEQTTRTELIFTRLDNKLRLLILKDGAPTELLQGYRLIINEIDILIDGKSLSFEMDEQGEDWAVFIEDQNKNRLPLKKL